MEKEKEYIIDRIPRLLKAEEIECRVGTIKGNGLTLLLYKDARTDMRILNETYGNGYWQRTHEVINGNLFCNIEVWNDKINQWVKKQDVGTESFTEKEKGEASDSFKRAGFNFGIGVELYTSPFIWITPRADMKPYNTKDLNNEPANEFYLYKQNAYTTKTVFKVSKIGYNDNREINRLEIVDNKGNVRFSLVPEEEQKEILNLMVKMNELVSETHKNFEDITKYYKVESTSNMTLEQLKDCVSKLEKMKGKNKNGE